MPDYLCWKLESIEFILPNIEDKNIQSFREFYLVFRQFLSLEPKARLMVL